MRALWVERGEGGEKGFKWPNAKSQKRENEFKGN